LMSQLRTALGGNPAIGADWPTVGRLVREAQAAHTGSVTVIAADRTEHEVLSSIELASSEVPELRMHHERTSAILGEGRLRRWLVRLEVSVPPDPFATLRLRFARFLELCGAGWEARAEQMTLNEGDRDALTSEFRRPLWATGTSGAEIIRTLGDPYDNAPSWLQYDLGLRGDYLYEFRVLEDEYRVIDSGYVRRKPRPLSFTLPGSDADAATLRQELVRMGVTSAELRALFGEPSQRGGRWPQELWTFAGPMPFGVELRLGVVE
jgi:hypothetical protein